MTAKTTTQKIGILGGGQLGAMLIKSAINFGVHISVLDKNPDAPANRYTSSFVCGDPLNFDDVVSFGKQCDIITIEKEAVNTDALRSLQAEGVLVFPSPDLIAIIQDKHYQKELLHANGIMVAPWIMIDGKEDLIKNTSKLPACLKMRRNGYDGKGVKMIKSIADFGMAFDEPSILEEIADIDKELSVVVTRNKNGEIASFDPVVMVFDAQNHILDYQYCPANIHETHLAAIKEIASKIAEITNLVGILAIEMFLTKDGNLLVNELAPRPHNSGHHTIEACATSQYDQHMRAILGLPPGSTRLKYKAAGMVNIISGNKDVNYYPILERHSAHLHHYGKSAEKPGRKIGHITITEDSIPDLLTEITNIKNLLN
jgi:5-(carboxyamino)imidazole ribonucleotide synthase